MHIQVVKASEQLYPNLHPFNLDADQLGHQLSKACHVNEFKQTEKPLWNLLLVQTIRSLVSPNTGPLNMMLSA